MEEVREKGKGNGEVEEELKGLKLLKKGGILVGKKSRVCTPPPTWTFEQSKPNFQSDPHCVNSKDTNFNIHCSHCHSNSDHFGSSVTARQLGANLWEVLPHLDSLARMNNHSSSKGGAGLFSKLSNAQKNKGLELEDQVDTTPSDDQPVSTGSFHRQIAASVMRHHRAVDRNGRALQPVSPASYSSSMEVTPYNPAATPSSSMDYRGKMGDPSRSLKTSTELLKILNRIWYLEEHHSSNISLMKALKSDLDNAQLRIKELLREKQMDRKVIDELMKQVAEHKLTKINIDQDRVQSALQSVREELEDERKLRKRSESLHRKLAREISEIKSSFSKASSDLERERRARVLLEDLCDEFAIGIRDYEQEHRSLKQVPREDVDSLVLHMSEAWLDERVQMKLAEATRKDETEKRMVMDKLRPEIETFLKARQTLDLREQNIDFPTKDTKWSGLRRQSLESFPLNEATSAPRNGDDDDDSIDSDSHCFELNREYHNRKNAESSKETGKCVSEEVKNGRSLSSLQARFEKHMGRGITSNGKKQEGVGEELLERRSKRFGSQKHNVVDNVLRTNSSSLEGERVHPETDLGDNRHGHFLLGGPASPVKKWDSKIALLDDEVECSSRKTRNPRETSLRAKLLEARLEGRSAQSKGGKGS